MDMGGATFEVTSSFQHSGSNSLILNSNSGVVLVQQQISNPGEVGMSISFYGAAGGVGYSARLGIQGDNCGGSNHAMYNFLT